MPNLPSQSPNYELRKTIRFLLKPVDFIPENSDIDVFDTLKSFCEIYKNVINSTEGLIFYKEKSEYIGLSKDIKIKHAWLKVYTKSEYFVAKDQIVKFSNGRKQSNKVTVNEASVTFLKEYFQRWIVENHECIEALNEYLSAPEHNQRRRAEGAFWLEKINKRSNFEFIFELFNGNIEHKVNNKDISNIFDNLERCKKYLSVLASIFKPCQSLGVEIARASLNYYTVNKKPKNYPSEIHQKRQGLHMQYNFNDDEKGLLNKVSFFDLNLPLGELKEKMKQFKAQQKSAFYEFVSRNKSHEALKKDENLKLLNDIKEENFNKFSNEADRQKRGKHFQSSFKNYENFSKLYKKVAIHLGRIKAEIRALEREQVDAEKLQSWAIIGEHELQKYLVLIPRDAQSNLSKAKKYINDLKDTPGETWKFSTFESLTLRALDKLCFGFDKNTFMASDSSVCIELKSKYSQYFEAEKLKRKDQFSEDGKELIKFYQMVLSLDATKTVLAINNFDGLSEVLQKEYESLDGFETDLKKSCYYKREIFISEETKNTFLEQFSAKAYKITSYDLEKERVSPERHTNLWLDFWANNNGDKKYPIRLNPELKISFVDDRSEELEGRDLGCLSKNRRKEKQFLLSTTISVNAHGKNIDLSFKAEDEVRKFFETFNANFNQERRPFEQYYYGLDRGQKELLTLGMFKFSETEKINYLKNDGTPGECHQPQFIDLEVYKIKADKLIFQNSKGGIVYKSPDQFIDDFEVIERTDVISCLDLSCAKLIKGKIVENGDIATYLALKMASARRKIYEGATREKYISDNICFNSDRQSYFLNYENRGKSEDEDLYFWDSRFALIVSRDEINRELQAYYDQVKNKQNYQLVTIEKINHLRDAICANAVGILHHLYSKYTGMFVFEDLRTAQKERHLVHFSGNLASRIEQKVLQKFQSDGLVPPALKRILNMQSAHEIAQLGCILYVSTDGTSSACPICETKNDDKAKKWGNHSYICINNKCNFTTEDQAKRRELGVLNNSDQVASYNIAKRGMIKMKMETVKR